MIRIQCDNCEEVLEIADELAGTKYPCPHCGDINRVPAAATIESKVDPTGTPRTSERVDKAAAAGYPPDTGPEVRVMKVRRCWARSRMIRFALAVLVALVGAVGLVWVPVTDQVGWYYALFVPMTLGMLGLIAWWWVARYTASLEITTKRTVMHHGLFSRSTSEVVHDNIRNVTVDQSFLQRVYKVGKLGIASSGQDGIEIQVNHLPAPDKLREIIDLYRPL
ncbi:MAG: PH domain-containing protein [Phycisphaerales bacterium]|nr:PH domain-containing protein [Phycisphaerales bacterium]